MSGERNRHGLFDAAPFNSPMDDFRRSAGFQSLTGVAITRLWTGDWVYAVDPTSAAVTVTLPTIGDEVGHHHIVKRIAGGSNAVKIVSSDASAILDGSATHSIAFNNDVRVYFCDGTQYRLINRQPAALGASGSASFSGDVGIAGNLVVGGTGRTSGTFNAGGNLTAEATAFFNNDGNFSAALVSSNPTLTVDTNDYYRYNRSTNQHLFGVGGGEPLRIDAAFVFPGADNAVTLGGGSNRWVEVFAVNGTINTSDGEEKADIAPLTDAERRVGQRLRGLIRRFRWIDSLARKGDGARHHIGLIAQDVAAAFAAEGLDGFRYGALCADEITEPVFEMRPVKVESRAVEVKVQTGVKGTGRFRLGVRYDQLIMLTLAAMEVP